jgi:hypothetical protein
MLWLATSEMTLADPAEISASSFRPERPVSSSLDDGIGPDIAGATLDVLGEADRILKTRSNP